MRVLRLISCFPSGGFATGHENPNLLFVRLGTVHFPDDAAPVENADSVAQGQDLIEFHRKQEYGDALLPAFEEHGVDELDGAHVQSSGWLVHDQQLGSEANSRPRTTFCMLPPERPPTAPRVLAPATE